MRAFPFMVGDEWSYTSTPPCVHRLDNESFSLYGWEWVELYLYSPLPSSLGQLELFLILLGISGAIPLLPLAFIAWTMRALPYMVGNKWSYTSTPPCLRLLDNESFSFYGWEWVELYLYFPLPSSLGQWELFFLWLGMSGAIPLLPLDFIAWTRRAFPFFLPLHFICSKFFTSSTTVIM